jgi:hypothetical protein
LSRNHLAYDKVSITGKDNKSRTNGGILALAFQLFENLTGRIPCRVPGENPRLTDSFHMCMSVARIEPTEVKGICSDDYATILHDDYAIIGF